MITRMRTGTPPRRIERLIDDAVVLSSPLLCNMLSDEQPVILRGTMVPAVTTRAELRNREPTEEEWENM